MIKKRMLITSDQVQLGSKKFKKQVHYQLFHLKGLVPNP